MAPDGRGARQRAFSSRGGPRRLPAEAGVIVVAALALGWLGNLFHGLLQGLDLALLAVLPTLAGRPG